VYPSHRTRSPLLLQFFMSASFFLLIGTQDLNEISAFIECTILYSDISFLILWIYRSYSIKLTAKPPFCFLINLQVTLIAQGDVPLSIVMTACTTIGAVVLTPFLTTILAGTYVPVDAVKLSISTLQVMLFHNYYV